VLKPEGVFILKWCETSIKIEDIIKLFPYPPIFGNKTMGSNPAKNDGKNHWLVFLKYDMNKKLNIN